MLTLVLELFLLLLAPVAAFFVVFANAERLAQLLTLVNLCTRELMDLVRLKALCIRSTTILLLS